MSSRPCDFTVFGALQLGPLYLDFGDIIFITDGESRVSPPFLETLQAAKKSKGFRIFGILVDVNGGRSEALAQFSDEIVGVHELTAGVLSDVFRKV